MKTYIEKQTKSFTEFQALADIIEGNKYQGDRKKGYIVGEFDNIINIPKEDFDNYFKSDITTSHRKATLKYCKNNVKVIYLRLYPEDKDIIQFLENIKEPTRKDNSRAGASEYIRKLIREDMKKQKGE
jgi:hypothetical protein